MGYDIVIGRNKEDKEKFKEQGLAYFGKGYVHMGNYTSLSNKIWLDVVRSHVILIAGKRGCLTGETPIFTDKGYKPIFEFNEKDDKVLSFNKTNKSFEWERAELLKYPIKNEEIIEIELTDGRKLKLTNEHPLLSSYGKYIYYRQAQELKVNDKIVLPTTLPEIKENKESLRIARLLGYILADGTIHIQKGRFKDGRGAYYNGTKARIRILNQSVEVLIQAKQDLEKEFNITAKRYMRNDCNCEVIETKQQKVVNKFIDLGIPKGLKSGIIRIPKVVFQSSNKFKSEFISALFDCDGYIPPKGRYLDYASKSRRFLEDLQILLTHLNIESVIRVKNAKLNGKVFRNYRLFITDNSSVNNFKKIRLRNKSKSERLHSQKYNETRRRKTHYPSENLVCTKIKSIKKVKGIKKVFDLSVNKNHSFIANGIISHNSGKSYTLSVLAEEITQLPKEVRENIAPLIFDTMGIFWTMKFKNEKDFSLLEEWDLKPRNLPVKTWAPHGYFDEFQKRNIPIDGKFALSVKELDIEDWLSIFNLNFTNPISLIIQKAIIKKHNDIREIIESIKDIDEPEQNKKTAISLFEVADSWKIFSTKEMKTTKIQELITPGTTNILDLSVYPSTSTFNVRALVIGLITRKLFNQRILSRKKEEIDEIQTGLSKTNKKESPLVWLFIDEAHEFLPKNSTTPATNSLIQVLREGRQPGISLVLATQQPGVIHRDVMTQSDLVISHRLTNKNDIEALNEIMQTYHLEGIKKEMNNLPDLKGSAIVLDDNSERLYPIRVRPKLTWHGGEAPKAIDDKN